MKKNKKPKLKELIADEFNPKTDAFLTSPPRGKECYSTWWENEEKKALEKKRKSKKK